MLVVALLAWLPEHTGFEADCIVAAVAVASCSSVDRKPRPGLDKAEERLDCCTCCCTCSVERAGFGWPRIDSSAY